MSKIQESLSRLFEHYKVIIWYDEIEDFRDDWESLQLVDVNKVLVNNNGFLIWSFQTTFFIPTVRL